MSYGSRGNIGSWLPAEIWGNYMRAALEGSPALNFSKPHGLVEGILIDTRTGLLVSEGCRLPSGEVREEIFLAGTEPKEISPRCWETLPPLNGEI